ncbi:MAG: hypothetical protein PHI35_05370 [Victivallaceae bacterium]|nr:hypothetical protein [Victivallaceae bacterium]
MNFAANGLYAPDVSGKYSCRFAPRNTTLLIFQREESACDDLDGVIASKRPLYLKQKRFYANDLFTPNNEHKSAPRITALRPRAFFTPGFKLNEFYGDLKCCLFRRYQCGEIVC